jgi:predicted GH43/DUF377 family glycosyl hydrolase
MFTVTRSKHNPILSPDLDHSWEAAAAFNASPVIHDNQTYLIYRAMSDNEILKEPHIQTSTIAVAHSSDGIYYDKHRQLVINDSDFDKFGCEDPRVTKFEGKFYIFYTGLSGYPFSAENIKVAVAISNDLKTIEAKHPVTPFNAKAMAIFPERINGKVSALVTINPDRKPSDICYVECDNIEQLWSESFWHEWLKKSDNNKLKIRRYAEDHVELGSVPLKTDHGWLVIYAHIQRYGRDDHVFGIEALLLDLNDPRKVIGKTDGPFLIPETYYDRTGQVSHTIFPSGALIRNDKLEIYYGAADTHTAFATIPLKQFMKTIIGEYKKAIKRYPGNPIISPRPGLLWEQGGTLNPAAIDIDGKVHLLYRAATVSNQSTIGYASSFDGLKIDERPDKPIYFPREKFESKTDNSPGYGCEDPRIVEINDKLYMSYTGYDGVTPRVAISSISKSDFINKKWSAWSKPEAITPPNIPNKDATILPEPVKNRYMVFHRVHEVVCADFVDSLDFSKEKIDQCIEIIEPRRGMWDGLKVGISCPPIKTPKGWLMLYHGVSWSAIYRVGAVLLDLEDPTIVRARTAVPILEPQESYEMQGIVSNVVFPCGNIVRNGKLYIYYGAADKHVGVAYVDMEILLEMLES